ncbi:hypothetical protein HQ403_01925 [Candidatus Kaiserbacteria bacterium]|nr:hypothetical protein [Candidatus Kaiserbacteria bacterium]
MHSKGVLAFLVWTFGNILALPLFGLVLRYLPASRGWLKFTPLFFIFLYVEYFAITLNLQAIKSALGGGIDISSFVFVKGDLITPIVIITGLAIVFFINKYGLKGSMLTDIGQYAVQLVGVVTLAGAGYLLGERMDLLWLTPDGRDWLLFGFLGIITGALGTGHQWQRFSAFEGRDVLRIGLWGGLFFGIYMFFVYLSGLFFTQNIILGVIFLIIILSVATSTIDSAVAGLQFIARKFKLDPRAGSLVAIIAVMVWPFLSEKGLTNLWGIMVQVRYPTVLIAVGLTAMYHIFKPNSKIRTQATGVLQKYLIMFKGE